ncbi:MAG: hypothetical protein ACXWP5_01890 [Bdellovibrionota bacterium]
MDMRAIVDQESEGFFRQMGGQEKVIDHRVPGVRLVLVVLSAKAMVFDMDSLRQKIVIAYPDAAVFFQTTMGKPIGPLAPKHVDLLIDLTGPGTRQGLFAARRLRKLARVTVGRNAGLFRKKIYDRVFDESAEGGNLPTDVLESEREVQKRVLALAGVFFTQQGDPGADRGKSIALELPAMQRL